MKKLQPRRQSRLKQKKQPASISQQKKSLNNDRKQSNNSSVKPLGILQTIKGDIDLINLFNGPELQFLAENCDIIVFERGMVLAKQKQVVDFIGVILNGGAVAEKSKLKYKKNSFIGHAVAIFGLQNHRHPQTITAESDGILFSIRIQTLIASTKNQTQNTIKCKISNFIAQQTLCQLKGTNHMRSSITGQFEAVDDKISHKFYQSNKLLSSLLQCIADPKQRLKFQEQFPLHCCKSSTLIASKHAKPYLLIPLKGQVTVKYGLSTKKQYSTVQINSVYNVQGFILDHNQFSNLYCTSSQAIFLIVDKQHLVNNFKLLTQCAILKYCLEYAQKCNQYQFGALKYNNEQAQTNSKQKQEIWSPFKKPYTIEEIPVIVKIKQPATNKSNDSTKTPASTKLPHKKRDSINAFQSLYQLYSSMQSKTRLNSKQTTQLTQYNLNDGATSTVKLQRIKTEFSVVDEKTQNQNAFNQKVKKMQTEILVIKESNHRLADDMKLLKLQLLETRARLKMTYVFKQVRGIKGLKQTSKDDNSMGKLQKNTLTLKKAFQAHLNNKKLELLVAKCAFKWLQITRRNRHKRQQNQLSTSSLHKQPFALK